MRVRMTGTVSGSRNGVDWPARGEELELPDDEGALLCQSGIAEPVADREKPATRPARGKAETRAKD